MGREDAESSFLTKEPVGRIRYMGRTLFNTTEEWPSLEAMSLGGLLNLDATVQKLVGD